MSIENFKNPWAKGGEYYPDWLGGEKVLGKSAISSVLDDEEFQNLDENFDSIDVVIESSPIIGVKQMSFIKTNNNNPDLLRVRYLDEAGEVQWVGDNFKVGTLEYQLFNREDWYYDTRNKSGVKSPTIVLEGTAKTPKIKAKFWVAWDRYKIPGAIDTRAPANEPNGRPFKRVFANSVQPNSLFFFTAYFENHSITKITNQTEVARIIQDIKKTFENDGTIKVKAKNASLSRRQVAFLVVGYHSPETTNNTGLNNSQLAIGRAKTIESMLNNTLHPIGINEFKAISGGESQEPYVRPAIAYFGVKAFINNLSIQYTPPTLGE